MLLLVLLLLLCRDSPGCQPQLMGSRAAQLLLRGRLDEFDQAMADWRRIQPLVTHPFSYRMIATLQVCLWWCCARVCVCHVHALVCVCHVPALVCVCVCLRDVHALGFVCVVCLRSLCVCVSVCVPVSRRVWALIVGARGCIISHVHAAFYPSIYLSVY